MMAMHSPYGMELVENCLACKLCSGSFFCHLPKSVMEAFHKQPDFRALCCFQLVPVCWE